MSHSLPATSDSSSVLGRYLEEQRANGESITPDEMHFLQSRQAKRSPKPAELLANKSVNNNNNSSSSSTSYGGNNDKSELSTRIMRSGLTRVGQLVRTERQNLLPDDVRFLEEKMRDQRYQALWQRQGQQQEQHQHQRPQQQHHGFSSVDEVTAELRKVIDQQKTHLLAAVDCEARIKELWWYRHALEEKKGGDKDKGKRCE